MERTIKFLILGAMVALVQTGCVNDKTPGTNYPGKVDGPVFNFATEATYSLNFQYNVPAGYVVGFDVYTVNPFETDADGQFRLKVGLEPVDRGFTNDRGAYNAPLTLPSYVKQVYIYTTYAGVPERLLTAKVENGQLLTPEAIEPGATETVVAAAKSSTRAGAAINARESDAMAFKNLAYQTLTLGKWYVAKDGMNPSVRLLNSGEEIKIYGRPVTMSYVDKARFGAVDGAKDALTITPAILKSINKALPGDGKGAVDQIYLKTGDINVTKEAELDLVFIQNWGAYYNTLAYYCYNTNTPPSSISDIKYQVVAIPNAMEQKMDMQLSSYFDVAAMYQGEGVKLKYVDQNGQMHDKFPAGTSVGWILYRNGFSGYATSSDGAIKAPSVGVGANFSSTRFGQHPNTAVLRTGDFVVIGFDDGEGDSSKRDYLDVVFNVQSTPSDAIIDKIPDVDPPVEPEPVVVKKMGVLLYEDLWPFQGDFDMNDVVVKYVSEATKNKDNKITEAKIAFTIAHSGASFNNNFLYQDPNIANATITFDTPQGVAEPTVHQAQNIIQVATKVLDYANKPEKVTFTVNYKFTTPIDSFDAPFNPFIAIGDDFTKEVHLTNYAPSPFADMSIFTKRTHDFSNPDLGLYYITFENITAKPEERGQQLPFAVNIAFDTKEAMDGFRVTVEGHPISRHYPGFVNWIRTGGKENADWYLHYKE